MHPLSIKITLSATARAKPISWVTTTIVVPSAAKSTITSRTSLIISGSNALVGSSKSMSLGFIANARAIAARCCCPPEICEGSLSALSAIPTFSNCSMAICSANFFSVFFTTLCARVILSKIVRWA